MAMACDARIADDRHLADNAALIPEEVQAAFQAAVDGDVAVLRRVLGESLDILTTTNEFKQQLAHVASRFGKTEAVKLLLEQRSAVDNQDCWGYTPLMQASFFGQAEVVDILLKAGANTQLRDKYGLNALYHARKAGHVEAERRLVPCCIETAEKEEMHHAGGIASSEVDASSETEASAAAFQAAEAGDVAVLGQLLGESAELANATSKRFNATLLHVSSRVGSVEAVKLLLEHRSEVDHQDMWGYTPLMQASFWGRTEVVEALLEAGANTQLRDKYGLTALFHARNNEHVEAERLLESSL